MNGICVGTKLESTKQGITSPRETLHTRVSIVDERI